MNQRFIYFIINSFFSSLAHFHDHCSFPSLKNNVDNNATMWTFSVLQEKNRNLNDYLDLFYSCPLDIIWPIKIHSSFPNTVTNIVMFIVFFSLFIILKHMIKTTETQ